MVKDSTRYAAMERKARLLLADLGHLGLTLDSANLNSALGHVAQAVDDLQTERLYTAKCEQQQDSIDRLRAKGGR